MATDREKSPFVLRLEDEMQRAGIPDRADLARAMGVSYHRVNPWWVRPGAKPSAADLLTLARLFSVSEKYLLLGGERRSFRRMEALLARAESLDEAAQDDLESYLDYLEAKTARQQAGQEPS